MNAEVFISYATNDRERVLGLVDRLRDAGVTVWIDQAGIDASSMWSQEIVSAIKGCKVMLLSISPHSTESENVVKEDRFTTIHIQELTCVARDTKLGSEEITSDIPNVGESALAKLDESGIVHIGAEVNQIVKRLGMEIIDVRIRRADYPEATSQNIFNRMRSEREQEYSRIEALDRSRTSLTGKIIKQ